MEYRFDITLTEEDYIAYNQFHAFESPQGKKQMKRSRLLLVGITAVLIVSLGLHMGRNTVFAFYTAAMVLYLVVYLLFYKKIVMFFLKRHIKRTKKQGKLPYEPVVTMEFYADHFVEIAPSSRTEQRYSSIERIYVVPDQFVLLYLNTITAGILPISQLRQQVELEDFLAFLSEKCPTAVWG